MALCSEQRFPYFLAWATVMQGWALAALGQGEAGVAQMRQGLAAHRATGAEEHRPFFLALLAEACGSAGQVEEGLSVLTEALTAVDKTGERAYEAELYRLKGELLQKQATATGAVEECFRHAVSVARQQGAKSLELRAVMSLSRLLRAQGPPGPPAPHGPANAGQIAHATGMPRPRCSAHDPSRQPALEMNERLHG